MGYRIADVELVQREAIAGTIHRKGRKGNTGWMGQSHAKVGCNGMNREGVGDREVGRSRIGRPQLRAD
jgi:hypothetical protein